MSTELTSYDPCKAVRGGGWGGEGGRGGGEGWALSEGSHGTICFTTMSYGSYRCSIQLISVKRNLLFVIFNNY